LDEPEELEETEELEEIDDSDELEESEELIFVRFLIHRRSFRCWLGC